MRQTIQRQLSVSGIRLQVVIDHSHLPALWRIEDSTRSQETLEVEISVSYYATPNSPPSFADIFNYAPIVHALKTLDQIEVDGTLEALADVVLSLICDSAEDQSVVLANVMVRIRRPLVGIVVDVVSTWCGVS